MYILKLTMSSLFKKSIRKFLKNKSKTEDAVVNGFSQSAGSNKSTNCP